MRGRRNPQPTMLAFVNLDERVPPDHPLRIIKQVADDAPSHKPDDFNRMYSRLGRASVPTERLLKSRLLISLYSIRSERGLLPGAGLQPALLLVPGYGPDGAERYECRSLGITSNLVFSEWENIFANPMATGRR